MSSNPKHQKQHAQHHSIIKLGTAEIGRPHQPLIIAGPCAVESYEQLRMVGDTLNQLDVTCLRGGAFKPRTSPYSFQGLGMEGIKLLDKIRQEMDLNIVTEVMTVDVVEAMAPYIDCFQVGARNMQNYDLLKALGSLKGDQQKPVLLKRGLSATLSEFLNAAEYILAGGNPNVILCERGIRSFDSTTRNVLDLAGVAYLKQHTHLPVVVDPSHATGRRDLIIPTARAAIAVGADGLMIETHPQPDESVSDAAQALSLDDFEKLVHQVYIMTTALEDCHQPIPNKVRAIREQSA